MTASIKSAEANGVLSLSKVWRISSNENSNPLIKAITYLPRPVGKRRVGEMGVRRDPH